MSGELLNPGQNIINRFLPKGEEYPLIPPPINQKRHPDSPVFPVDFSQTQHISKPNGNIRNAWEGWKRKNEPIWKRKEGLAGFARINHLLKKLSAAQQEAITAIFPEGGGHNSVKEAAKELHRSPSAVRSALEQGMKQLESKRTTGEFLKKGRPRKPAIDVSSSKEKRTKLLKRERKERVRIAQWARERGLFEKSPLKPLSLIQKQVLNEAFPLNGGYRTWKEVGDKFTSFKSRKRFYKVVATGIKKIKVIMAGGSVSSVGRPRKPRELFVVDSYLKKSKGIKFERTVRRTKSQVSREIAIKIRELASQGMNVNQIAAGFKNKYSRYLISEIALRYEIQIGKSNVGRPRKVQSSFA